MRQCFFKIVIFHNIILYFFLFFSELVNFYELELLGNTYSHFKNNTLAKSKPVLSDCEGHADPVIPDCVQYPKRLAHVGERVRGPDTGPESSRRQKRFPELSGAHQLLLVLRIVKKAGGLDAVLYGFRQNFPTKIKT